MIGERIRTGRAIRGLSLRALASKIGRSHEAVRKYEAEEIAIDSDLLADVAAALALPIEYFLREKYLDTVKIAHRHGRIGAHQLAAIEADAAEAVERFLQAALLANAAIIQSLPIDFPKQVTSFEEVERAAEALRSAWKLGLDAIGPLVPILESRGVPVIALGTETKFDACTVAFDSPHGSGFIIAVKPDLAGDRMRFSLTHELAHMCLECDGIDVEKACDRFASAFLMSEWAMRAELGGVRTNLSLTELSSLKGRYGISMAALLRRSVELNLLSEDRRRAIRSQVCEFDDPTRERGPSIAPERPNQLNRLVERLLSEGTITERRAAELVGMGYREWRRSRPSFR